MTGVRGARCNRNGAGGGNPPLIGAALREAWSDAESLGCVSPLDKSRGGTPTGERALTGRVPRASAEVTEQRPIGVPLPVFLGSSLRAKRSNPVGQCRYSAVQKFCTAELDCFVASLLAMTNAAPIVMNPALHCRMSSDEDRICGEVLALA